MITLKELARSDRAVGAITTDECHLVAAVLEAASRSWLFRQALPKQHREKALSMRMLASVLGRTKAESAPADLRIRIYQAMQEDK